MPSSRHALGITNAYRRRLLRLRAQVAGHVADRWRLMDFADLDGSFDGFAPAAQSLIALGQRHAVTLTDAYLAAYLSAELDEGITPRGIDPDLYAGRTRDGRPIGLLLAPALYATKLALAQLRGERAAIASGLARVARVAATEVVDAARSSLGDVMRSDERISGWRRVPSDDPCGACLALADGEPRATDLDLEIHANCSCTAEPIVDGSPDDVARPTGAEMFDAMSTERQDALFEGSGGADKADLIRTDAIDIADLITRTEHPEWGETIYETPLEALTD